MMAVLLSGGTAAFWRRWAMGAASVALFTVLLTSCSRRNPEPSASTRQPSSSASQPSTSATGSSSASNESTAAADASMISQGKQVYAAERCADCHRISGQGETVGPDLSHIGSVRSRAWLRTKITDPKASDPQSEMPAYELAHAKLSALVDYLYSLK